MPEENMQWVAVAKHRENLDKRRARQGEARARKAEEENKLLQQRLKLKEKVGGEEVSVQDCLLLLETEEFHRKPLDEVLQRLEARWLHATAAEKTWRDRGYFRAGIKEVAKKMPLEPQGRPSLYEQLCAVEHDFRWPGSEWLAASYVQPRPVWETKRETQEKAAVAAAVARAAAEAADAKVAAEKAAAEAAAEREFGVRPVWEFPPPGLRRDEYIFSLMIRDLL